MVNRTDEPLADFYRDDAEKARWLSLRPVCDECGEPITGDWAYKIGGGTYCEDCVEQAREYISNYDF